MTPDPPTTTGVDGPPPTVDVPPRGGVLGFLGTVPGILTGVAGLITALGTVYGIHHGASSSGSTLTEPPASPPPVATSVDAGSVAAEASSAPVGAEVLGDEATALMTNCANGFAEDCVALLELLVQDCGAGDPWACDALYYITPVGSDYEDYGATCGGRFGWEYAGRCSEL